MKILGAFWDTKKAAKETNIQQKHAPKMCPKKHQHTPERRLEKREMRQKGVPIWGGDASGGRGGVPIVEPTPLLTPPKLWGGGG